MIRWLACYCILLVATTLSLLLFLLGGGVAYVLCRLIGHPYHPSFATLGMHIVLLAAAYPLHLWIERMRKEHDD